MLVAMIGFCRAGAWLNAALSSLNAGILLFDGLAHSDRLPTQYLIVTVTAGLLFGVVGVVIFGMHWGLNRIRGHSTGSADPTAVAERAWPWKVVHLVLGAGLATAAALMASTAVAMIGRLGRGLTIFG